MKEVDYMTNDQYVSHLQGIIELAQMASTKEQFIAAIQRMKEDAQKKSVTPGDQTK